MAATQTITVTTEDAQPTTAPHRVSNKAGWNAWTADIVTGGTVGPIPGASTLPSFNGRIPWGSLVPGDWVPGAPQTPGVKQFRIGAWRVMVGGLGTPATGKRIGGRGAVCSSDEPCGPSVKCSSWAWTHKLGDNLFIASDYATVNDGGGDHTVTLNVAIHMGRAQRWQ